MFGNYFAGLQSIYFGMIADAREADAAVVSLNA